MAGGTDDLDIAADGLSELVHHYAHAVAMAPSAAVYDELLSARSFAGTLIGRARLLQRGPQIRSSWRSLQWRCRSSVYGCLNSAPAHDRR